MDLNNLKSDPIVVLGGGFGGLSTVMALLLKSDGTPIILIDQSPRFLFKPLMYELLSGELELWEVAPKFTALASELGFVFLQDRVVEVDEFEKKLITSTEKKLKYSQLVISTGVTTDYSMVDGLQEYACGFSNLDELLRIKELITKIKKSSESQNPLIISGAGPTGVELACKIFDLIDDPLDIYLIEKGNKILPTAKSFNREKAIDQLVQRNIKIYLNHYVQSVNENVFVLANAAAEKNKIQKVNYSGLIWTGGLKSNSPRLLHNFSKGNNKIKVNHFLQSNESENIFFVGDIIFNENNPFPSSAQAAMQQGLVIAENIIALRKGLKLQPFEFEDKGEMLSLGLGNASITGYGITLAGPLAYEIRRFIYLMRMPGLSLSLKSVGSMLLSKQIINGLFSQYP